MIDDLGNRYDLVRGSEIVRGVRSAPPKVPLRHWLTFEAPKSGASKADVYLSLTGRGERVALRDIAVPR